MQKMCFLTISYCSYVALESETYIKLFECLHILHACLIEYIERMILSTPVLASSQIPSPIFRWLFDCFANRLYHHLRTPLTYSLVNCCSNWRSVTKCTTVSTTHSDYLTDVPYWHYLQKHVGNKNELSIQLSPDSFLEQVHINSTIRHAEEKNVVWLCETTTYLSLE